jgi:hypothetical protein
MLEHRHEMILILPVFLALGFVSGWIVRSLVPDIRHLHPALKAGLLVVGLIFIVFLAKIAAWIGWLPNIWDSFGIGLAAYAVGGAAGWWFTAAKSLRDKAIFVGSAALFMFVVALEYDTKIFDRLSKLEAGGVDLELTGPKPEQVPVKTAIGGSGESAAFPRTTATDDALKTLYAAGQMVLRDERYASVLSGTSGSASYDNTFAASMSKSLRDFATYACKKIERDTRYLIDLQEFHRSETSALAIDPRLIGLLRREYLKQEADYLQNKENFYDNEGMIRSLKAGCAAVCKGDQLPQYPPPGLGEGFCQAEDWIVREWLAMQRVKQAPGLPDNWSGICKDTPPEPEKAPTAECTEFLANKEVEKGRSASEDAASYLAYLAIVTASAEAGIGNSESAITLLERASSEQQRTVERLQHSVAPSCQGDTRNVGPDGAKEDLGESKPCTSSERAALKTYLRALLALIRLEVVETNLMDSDQSNLIGPSRLKRMKWTTDHIDIAIAAFRKSPNYLDLFMRYNGAGAFIEETVTKCASNGDTAPENAPRKVLATLAYVDLVQRNNALDLVGHNRPEYAKEYPDLIRWLEKSATLVSNFASTFRLKCAERAAGTLIQPVAPQMMESVGSFWEAAARNFNFPPEPATETAFSDSADLRVITSFCEAKKAYKKAELTCDGKVPTSLLPGDRDLKSELKRTTDVQFCSRLAHSIERVQEALASFPAGELAKVADKTEPQCPDDLPSAKVDATDSQKDQ